MILSRGSNVTAVYGHKTVKALRQGISLVVISALRVFYFGRSELFRRKIHVKQGLGFGPYMQDTIDLMRSGNVRVQDNPTFGHLDAYLTAEHTTYADGPILNWLNTVVFANDDDNHDDQD